MFLFLVAIDKLTVACFTFVLLYFCTCILDLEYGILSLKSLSCYLPYYLDILYTYTLATCLKVKA